MNNPRGYFGIGIENGKRETNLGTLWRTASIMGASFIFTIGTRYKNQSTDTMKSWRHIPLFKYESISHFYNSLPKDSKLIGIELDAHSIPISKFQHPERGVYLLGAEDHGLSNDARDLCDYIIQIPGDHCLNVAVAGSIALYDRILKEAV